jgi:hypothetical protein
MDLFRKIIQLVILILFFSGSFAFSGGNGTLESPFQISNCTELMDINHYLDSHFVLTQDFSCYDYCMGKIFGNPGTECTPIGSLEKPFSGTIDGNYHNIQYFMVQADDAALFSYTSESAIIKKVGLINTQLIGTSSSGGLVAQNRGLISDCFVTGYSGSTNFAGGIVGLNFGIIERCFMIGSLMGNYQSAGGITSYNSGTIINSFFISDKTNFISNDINFSSSGYHTVGGIAGSNSGLIKNSFSSGKISGAHYFGGIAGQNSGTIQDSFTTAELFLSQPVQGKNIYFGNLVGFNSGQIINCYYSEKTNIGSVFGEQKPNNYFEGIVSEKEPFTKWDFQNTWYERNNVFPRLIVPNMDTIYAPYQYAYAESGEVYAERSENSFYSENLFNKRVFEKPDYSLFIIQTPFGEITIFLIILILLIIVFVGFYLVTFFFTGKQFPFINPTVISLLLANLLVMDMVVVNGWLIYEILIIYWFQSVIIGFFQFLKILSLKRFSVDGFKINNHPAKETENTKNFTAIFFAFHYGLFHFVYFIFLVAQGGFIGFLSTGKFYSLSITVIIFLINHAFSFMYYKQKIALQKPNIGKLMFQPYARIVPMHLFIVSGGLLSSGPFVTVFFISLKTIADLVMHLLEHKNDYNNMGQKATIDFSWLSKRKKKD